MITNQLKNVQLKAVLATYQKRFSGIARDIVHSAKYFDTSDPAVIIRIIKDEEYVHAISTPVYLPYFFH